MMTSRERELATIRHEIPDRIPVDAIHVEIGAAIAAALGIAENSVSDALGIDGRGISPPYIGPLPEPIEGFQLTPWGTADGGPYGAVAGNPYPLAAVASVAAVERYPWPDAAAYDYALAASKAHALHTQYAVRGPYWVPLFWRTCELFGMEEAMIKMVVQPAVYEAALEHVFAHVYEVVERMVAACGDDLDILCLGDDFATQRGMLVSPDLWRKFLKPRLAKLFAIGKRHGKPVWFHSCGDVTPILPDLIEIGVDLWETVQLHALPMSPERLKREYGRDLAFFGGVNTQHLPFATPAEVQAEVIRCIETLGAGGGYICGPDHHIKPDVPVQNALTLFQTARSFRRDGYTHPGV